MSTEIAIFDKVAEGFTLQATVSGLDEGTAMALHDQLEGFIAAFLDGSDEAEDAAEAEDDEESEVA